MTLLNNIVRYWYDCVKASDVLSQSLPFNSPSQAMLFPSGRDEFIFRKAADVVEVEDDRLKPLMSAVEARDLDLFYGYSIIVYLDGRTKRHCLVPLFVVPLSVTNEGGLYSFSKTAPTPQCGAHAFARCGLSPDQIAILDRDIQQLFTSNVTLDGDELADAVLEIVSRETTLTFLQSVAPSALTNDRPLNVSDGAGVLNKSIIFSGESNVFNVHLLRDLEQLRTKDDLDSTALAFLTNSSSRDNVSDIVPILPFVANEYQVNAIQGALKQRLTVVTGPPGTGKSQFIANLIVNLFFQKKSVLFVSHTGEAVDIVGRDINSQFKNLVLRTGKKELRQELKGTFAEILTATSKVAKFGTSRSAIDATWNTIQALRKTLKKLDALETKFSDLFVTIQTFKERVSASHSILSTVIITFKIFWWKVLSWNLRRQLQRLKARSAIETMIRKSESDFTSLCQQFVREQYLSEMFPGDRTGIINTVIDKIVSYRSHEDDGENNYRFEDALKVLRVWACTLKSLRATFPLAAGLFDYVIFDEASQVDLPSAAPALYRAKNVVVVGDPMQLSHIASMPTDMDRMLARANDVEVKDIYPARIRYADVSLYSSAERSLTTPSLNLIDHYRSEDEIISLSNRVFYGGRLRIMTTLDYSRFPQNLPAGLHWIDVRGETVSRSSGGRANMEEVAAVMELARSLFETIKGTSLTVGIVTAYSWQQKLLNDGINDLLSKETIAKHCVKVLTAHQFQGSQKDIMILSLVISVAGGGNSDRWYNSYPQILNVALTRARYLLYIVGDKMSCRLRPGTLQKIANVYDEIKNEQSREENYFNGNLDSPAERVVFEQLNQSQLASLGYKLIPKLVVKRYTLDFALVGNERKLNIEVDGMQHEIISGVPVLEDVERDAFLRKEGWEILRFSSHEVLSGSAISEKVVAHIG